MTSSYACNCQGELSIAEGIKKSDVVFTGKIISFTLTNNYDSLKVVLTGNVDNSFYHNWREVPILVVRVKVESVYKGRKNADTLTVLTPPTSAGCGFKFQLNQKYIIYATKFDKLLTTEKAKRYSRNRQTFWTHQCTRTTVWNKTEEEGIIKEKHYCPIKI